MPGATMAYTAMHKTNQPKPPSQPVILPYRDNDNTTIRYATTSPSNLQQQNINDPYSAYDSDMEPLVTSAAASNETQLDEEALNRFTATGRPIPAFKASAMANNHYFMGAPQLLPKRYTDESVIPAIVVDVIPSPPVQEGEGREVKEKPRRPSFLSKLKPEKTKAQPTSLTKVIYMPRGEYLKYFARNQAGEYIGTEPYKQWTEIELEETFVKYKPVEKKGKKGRASFVF